MINISLGPSSAPTNSSANIITKTPKSTIIGQKRPLAERTDNETNLIPKKKLSGTRKIAEPKPRKQTTAPMDLREKDENIEEEKSSNLSRSSGRSLHPKPKQTSKTKTINIYQDSE